MPRPPIQDAYTEAIMQHATENIVLETNVLCLTMLVSALQLAQRHPAFPGTIDAYVTPFITEAITQLRAINPIIARVIDAGNDPAQDGPVPAEDDAC